MVVVKDVCNILEIGIYHNAVARLKNNMRGIHSVDTLLVGSQQMAVVSKAGEASPNQNWILTYKVYVVNVPYVFISP